LAAQKHRRECAFAVILARPMIDRAPFAIACLLGLVLACGSEQAAGGGETGSETGEIGCPDLLEEPEFEARLRVGPCHDASCATGAEWQYLATPGRGSTPTSVSFELSCELFDRRGDELALGVELALACVPDPELEGSDRLLVRVTATPAGSAGMLDVEIGDALDVVIQNDYDGYSNGPMRTAVIRAEDGELLLLHNLVTDEKQPLEIVVEEMCSYPGNCGETHYNLELGFGPADARVWLSKRQAADLAGGLRAWVWTARSFHGANCGEFSERTTIHFVVAAVRE
jgi:hypothetical protein